MVLGYFSALLNTIICGLWIGWAADDLRKKKYTYFGIETAIAITTLCFAIRNIFFDMR